MAVNFILLLLHFRFAHLIAEEELLLAEHAADVGQPWHEMVLADLLLQLGLLRLVLLHEDSTNRGEEILD